MEKKIAIRGHKTRGRDVIRALERMGGTNEVSFDGSDPNYAYYIRHDFMISMEKLDRPPLGESYSLYTIEEYEAYMKNKKEAEHSSTEKLVDEALRQHEVPTGSIKIWDLPEGYIFKDENGNVINATKIVLEKKKKEYPKTYEECAKIMNCPIDGPSGWLFNFDANIKDPYYRKIDILMGKFTRLFICRDAYWKIAGEEMGLGKPWEPDWEGEGWYVIVNHRGDVVTDIQWHANAILAFPTEEMRDAFYENFKELIEICKELL